LPRPKPKGGHAKRNAVSTNAHVAAGLPPVGAPTRPAAAMATQAELEAAVAALRGKEAAPPGGL